MLCLGKYNHESHIFRFVALDLTNGGLRSQVYNHHLFSQSIY